MSPIFTIAHVVWSLPLLAVLIGWGVTLGFYVRARADLVKARQLARTKDALDVVTAIAPFLAPILGSALGAAASFAVTRLAQPAVVAGSEKARRGLAGMNSAIHVAAMERLEPQNPRRDRGHRDGEARRTRTPLCRTGGRRERTQTRNREGARAGQALHLRLRRADDDLAARGARLHQLVRFDDALERKDVRRCGSIDPALGALHEGRERDPGER